MLLLILSLQAVFSTGSMLGPWHRKYPIILPHELLPWLHRNGAFPEIAASELQKYWGRVRMRGGTVADVVSAEMESRCHPLYIWGDDAKYTSAHDKLLVIVMGHCLDPNTYSVECCWPLFALREVTWSMYFITHSLHEECFDFFYPLHMIVTSKFGC